MKRFVIFAILGASLLALFVLYKKTPKIPLAENLKNLEPRQEIIGKSVEGRDISAYIYGNGEKHLVFVGGIHGGYEGNSVLLADKFINYLSANPEIIPENLIITIIPSINPDGVYAASRFNANNVDLNRNFDCKWKPEGVWKGNIVSAGTKPFSEPETRALQDFVLKKNPAVVVFWHSQANAVYASECEKGILPKTLEIIKVYSDASGYPAIKSFNSYEVTGDAEGWLASINIPAITVELKTHEDIEWDKNLAGIKALFEVFDLESKPGTNGVKD